MRKFLETYLSCGPMGWVLPEGAMIFRGILLVMGLLQAVGRCFFDGWQIFADIVRLLYPGGLRLMINQTGPVLPYSYSNIPEIASSGMFVRHFYVVS